VGWTLTDGQWVTSNGLQVSGRAARPSGYNPSIGRGSMVWNLPWPIDQISTQHANRVTSLKIPLVGGVSVFDTRTDALNITLNGQIVTDTHAEQLEWKRFMYEQLILDTTYFYLYTYYTPGGYCRFYGPCYCRNLSFQHSTRTVHYLPYVLTVVSIVSDEYIYGSYLWQDSEGSGSPQIGEGGDGSDSLPASTIDHTGPVVVRLNDAAGAAYVVWEDSTGTPVVKINSYGDVQYTGLILGKSVI